MSKKALVISIVILIGLFMASCNTYQRCPAYSSVEIDVREADRV